MGIEFYYGDQWREFDLYSATTEQANHPKENSQDRDKNRQWRTKYGAGSGWGRFYIDSTNNKLYFVDNGSTSRTATISAATYDADSLAAEIETQMEAVTTDNFTVEYIEAGDNKNKFKITDDTGTFELTCTSTTNAIWDSIGFDTASDQTGADNYVADEIRIHTAEYIRIDLGSNVNIYAIFVINHNFQSTAEVRVRASTTAFGSWSITPTLDDITTNVAYKRWSSAQAYRYWELWFADIDNIAGYNGIGRIMLCTQPFAPARDFLSDHGFSGIDYSRLKVSESGGKNSVQFPRGKAKNYHFRALDESDDFLSMFEELGYTMPMIILEDPTSISNRTLYYGHITNWNFGGLQIYNDYWDISMSTEEE